MKGVVFFHDLSFSIKSFHTLHWHLSSFAILRNGRTGYGKVFLVSTAQRLQIGSFSLLERSKPKSTQYKISGLLRFSEIGKLRARKKIPLVEPGSVL